MDNRTWTRREVAYAYACLFVHAIDLAPETTSLTLPDDDRVRVMAITVTDEAGVARPVRPLYDALAR